METGTLISLGAFGFSLVTYLLTLAYFTGKYTQSNQTIQAQITQLGSDRLKDNERMDRIEEKMTDRYQVVDKEMGIVTTIVSKTERDIQEIKDTFKEFTHEVKETFKEFTKEIRAMINVK